MYIYEIKYNSMDVFVQIYNIYLIRTKNFLHKLTNVSSNFMNNKLIFNDFE